jgi:RimJ/RimL family protein N-acetyltransferase
VITSHSQGRINILRNAITDLLPDCLEKFFGHVYHAISPIKQFEKEDSQMSFPPEYNQQFCGAIGLTVSSDIYKITAEVGYWLGESNWKPAITTILVRLITHYALNDHEFLRGLTGLFEFPVGSMKGLTKSRYTKEAFLENQF